ncbi:type IA DNA topoisomerase [Alkalibacterium sp. 20]|uniref:type IA DNA topoisomerase n=1 Tax=Alkalibacterium sp. 20 TaxID=1798803 RepID=UPI0009003A90|nr:type IA DNA topoisomerase [Alkalibacterium sp. 20]OJF96172.1 DNA topoisomerase III [Alkalibacterium sp. 20]
MNKIVILAEKPSQAQAYANALGKQEKKNGYIEIKDTDYVVTWGFGHLVELAPPEVYNKSFKYWSISDLPITPQKYIFQVGKDKNKQFNIIKKLLKEADEIIVATDSDREGEHIARSIIKQAGCESKPTKRLWINSLEKDEILKGFDNLKNGKDYYPSYIEAQTRQISDWLVGINLSRVYTLNLKKKGISEGVFSVGRVQTPTLYMIYKRQQEVENFVSKPFYELFADVTVEKGTFEAKLNKKFATKEEIQKVYNEQGLLAENTGLIQKLETKRIKKRSPQLFSLSDLQSFINKLYKVSPSDTLKTVQSLYEKKLLSYPRTDCRFITDSEFNYLSDRLKDYLGILGYTIKKPQKEPNKRYVDGSKVQEHYAIVPTKTIPTESILKALKPLEKKIYNAVMKRTIAMFEEQNEYDETTVEVLVKELVFKAKGKTMINEGWEKLLKENAATSETGVKRKANSNLPLITQNEPCTALINTKEGKTTPPSLYTEGTLITAMKNSGKELAESEKEIMKEVEGIGTEATRANVLETLKRQTYIKVEKNIITVNPKGIILCKSVEGTLLSSPEMTAKWETYLKKINSGEGTQQAFLTTIEKFIGKTIADNSDSINNSDLTQEISQLTKKEDSFGLCPKCKETIVDKGKFYGCSGYSEGCRFTIQKELASKKITKTMVKDLLSKKETKKLKGFKNKSGKSFEAILILDCNNKVTFKPFK